jgi:hypothetical protein
MPRFWVMLTRCGGAESRYRKPSRSVEGDAESVFRPLAADTWASEYSGKKLGATVVGWRRDDSVQTCQKGAVAVGVKAGEGLTCGVHQQEKERPVRLVTQRQRVAHRHSRSTRRRTTLAQLRPLLFVYTLSTDQFIAFYTAEDGRIVPWQCTASSCDWGG